MYWTPSWIRIVWAAVGVVGLVATASDAGATNHDHGNPRLHNQYIHFAATGHSSVDEDFCTQVVAGTLGSTTMRTVVDDAILTQPSHWDGAASYKLDFYHTASDCSTYTDRSWIEYQYLSYVTPSGDKWCGDGISCTSHFNAVTSSVGHQDFRNEVMYMEQDHVDALDATSRQIISHETGHGVGYRDPDSANPCPSAQTPSIMHIPYYGCTSPGTGPTSLDLNTFTNHLAAAAD